MDLFIFVQDFGWAGMIVVVAHNEEEARSLMKDNDSYYDKNAEVEKYNIEAGLAIQNGGDR